SLMSRRRIVLLVLLTTGFALGRAGCSVACRSQAETPAGPLRVELGARPARAHNIGTAARGGRAEAPVVGAKPGSAAVTVGPIRTSCEWRRVDRAAPRVEAGPGVGGRAVFDLAMEPGFAGGLMLDAEAEAAEDGRPGFALKLSVEVK